ncbi:MAG: PA14 domain-containing protein [Bacteroidota bacterium]
MINRIILFCLAMCFVNYAYSQCVGAQGQVKWYYWENVAGYDIEELYAEHSFPYAPVGFEVLTELAAPGNYTEGLGALAKGYIKVDVTDTYKFNVTGTDHVLFFLSTTDSPNDTSLVAELDGWSQKDEHDKYPEQTSDPINLTAGQYYYFELHQKDDNGWDHAQVYWQTSPSDDTWSIVPNINIYNYDCFTTCPTKGTPCDDGNANTTDDQEDGACNCIGVPTNLDQCVGERGEIRALYWDGIPGNDVEDLQADPDYPMNPDRSETIAVFKGPSDAQNGRDSTGTRVRAMLIAPETGDYQFNVTGDDETWLYLSTNENFELASVIAEVPGWTHEGQFDKYISQTSEVISLVEGQIYYIEVNGKQGTGGDHFGIAWKTPSNNEVWKYIDGVYLFAYDCDEACVPASTTCDDGDDTTHSDAYDENCNCVGIPCPNGDCSGLGNNSPSFPNYEECGPSDKHSNRAEDAWLSCVARSNPNPARGVSHWIQYNFNEIVPLGAMKIWNYNVANETGNGFRQVVIDYSMDGINWTELGQYNWQQAPGTSNYEGFNGPNFSGVQAQYVLITALNSFDDTGCMGFSQIQFENTACSNAGNICNAGNGETAVYDVNCDCRSLSNPFNECLETNLFLNQIPINTNNYSAKQRIESAGMVNSGSTVNMIAGQEIVLYPGFMAKQGANFLAQIIACDEGPEISVDHELKSDTLENRSFAFADPSKLELVIYPTPTNDWTTINFNLTSAAKINLGIFDNTGRLLYTLAKGQFYEAGSFYKTFPAQKLARGIYHVSLQTEQAIRTKSMVVVDNVQ